MSDILNNYGLYILAGLGVLIVIVVILLIVSGKKKDKSTEEDTSSILDVNVEGVVDKEFKYGYEKQETRYMKKEELKAKKEEK